MLEANSVSEIEKKKALSDLFKNEVTSAPFLSKDVSIDDEIKNDIVEYMLLMIKEYYNLSSTDEALKKWDTYKNEVLRHE